jgi:hypothetical protein
MKGWGKSLALKRGAVGACVGGRGPAEIDPCPSGPRPWYSLITNRHALHLPVPKYLTPVIYSNF